MGPIRGNQSGAPPRQGLYDPTYEHDACGVAFVATLQFLPGVLSVLYWPTANRRGFIVGLLAGISVWVVGMLLPLVGNLDVVGKFDSTQMLTRAGEIN